MFQWTDESIDWWKRAVPYSDYYKILIRIFREYLSRDETIFDIGCGLGNVSLELSPFVRRIKGFDINERVLNEFKKEIQRRGIDNISVSSEKWEKFKEPKCDTVIACSFGIMKNDLNSFLKIARKQVLVVRGRKEDPGMPVLPQGKEYRAGEEEKYLQEQKIPYYKRIVYAEFGQPLRSREEAVEFVRFYGMNDEEKINAFLDNKLITLQQGRDRYFLPNRKEVVIFVIPKEDRRDEKRK